jgi:MoaA/NifB/PqqE/SkfB family radical SAM enzyme
MIIRPATWGEPPLRELPASVIVLPTFRCGLRCRHCDLGRLRMAELEPEIWRVRLMELAGVVQRPLLVGISGGEPLLYEGIFEIISACRQVGLMTALATSTVNMTEGTVHRLLQAGISALVVSLDGDAATHDRLRRRPGLHAHALEIIRLVKRYSPLLQVSAVATVMRPTVGQLVSMARWVERHPQIDNICYHTLSANLGGEDELDPGWYRRSELWPGDQAQLFAELDQLMVLSDQGLPIVNRPEEIAAMQRFFADPEAPLRPCDQYDEGLLIRPDGGVKICPQQDPVANIKDNSLVALWRSDTLRDHRLAMARCRRSCHFMTNYAYQRHNPGQP